MTDHFRESVITLLRNTHYQAARLFELLPSAPNELWQADVTYIHIPGHGWWYAVTVIDYYSRYLLACHFTPSHRATDVNAALDAARIETPSFRLTSPGIRSSCSGSCLMGQDFEWPQRANWTNLGEGHQT